MSSMSLKPVPMAKRGGVAKTVLVLLILAVISAFAAYEIGKFQGVSQLRALQTRDAQALQAAQAQTAQVQTQLAGAQALNQLLQARSSVYQASAALDEHNFGTAGDDLKKASQILQSINASAAGLDPAKVADVQTKLNGITITVDPDLQVQHDAIAAAATEMDSLMPQ